MKDKIGLSKIYSKARYYHKNRDKILKQRKDYLENTKHLKLKQNREASYYEKSKERIDLDEDTERLYNKIVNEVWIIKKTNERDEDE